MDSGYYAACTALVSRTAELDTIANNLANASTVGFRAQENIFSTVLANAANPSSSALVQAINQYGLMSGTTLDLSQGTLQKTGNTLDAAIEGHGYFEIQTANGTAYTRNGGFQISATGQLVTSTGDQVMGDNNSPIVMPSGGKVSISADGTISMDGAVSGKLKIVEFPHGTQLTSLGSSYYSAPPNTAQPATQSNVRQGFLENSNVNAVAGMVELVNAQQTAEMMQRALSMFNSEMDKTATQDLPKAG